MKIFEQGYKTNFVDEDDVLVGFDTSQLCCEDFGWFLTATQPTEDNIDDLRDGHTETSEDHPNWYFDREYFDELSGEFNYDAFAVFKLVHRRQENDARMRQRERNAPRHMYLVLFNSHNGYYSHGFEVTVGGQTLRTGSL